MNLHDLEKSDAFYRVRWRMNITIDDILDKDRFADVSFPWKFEPVAERLRELGYNIKETKMKKKDAEELHKRSRKSFVEINGELAYVVGYNWHVGKDGQTKLFYITKDGIEKALKEDRLARMKSKISDIVDKL